MGSAKLQKGDISTGWHVNSGCILQAVSTTRSCAGTPVDDEDRYRFYLLLQEGVERYGHRVHAFCLMTNHIHLALQVADVPLSKINTPTLHLINKKNSEYRKSRQHAGFERLQALQHDAFFPLFQALAGHCGLMKKRNVCKRKSAGILLRLFGRLKGVMSD